MPTRSDASIAIQSPAVMEHPSERDLSAFGHLRDEVEVHVDARVDAASAAGIAGVVGRARGHAGDDAFARDVDVRGTTAVAVTRVEAAAARDELEIGFEPELPLEVGNVADAEAARNRHRH